MKSVILTDETGTQTGTAEILAAHTGEGMLHKAFSVFIFRNTLDEVLIQRRSDEKMLFPGIWANTCCSHPQKNETIVEAGERRLDEECGFTCPLSEHGSFVYKAEDPSQRGIEFEHDTILIGTVDDDIAMDPDPSEVAELKWMDVDDLKGDMQAHPDKYAPWFHQGLGMILNKDE